MATFLTKNGKEITTFVEPGSMHFRVKFTSGGELPQELSGVFTSQHFAERAITHYLQKSELKAAENNAKSKVREAV